MALIVEDGTGLAAADSYISLVDARTFAASYGLTLPVDDDEADITLRQGAVYVGLSEPSFSGQRLEVSQALAWPRLYAYDCYDNALASDSVPAKIKQAQVYAAAEYALGTDVRGSSNGKEVASEKVDVLEVSYFENGSSSSTTVITAANDAMASLKCNTGGRFSARSRRV